MRRGHDSERGASVSPCSRRSSSRFTSWLAAASRLRKRVAVAASVAVVPALPLPAPSPRTVPQVSPRSDAPEVFFR